MKSADLVGLAPKGSPVKMAERPYLAIDERGQYGGDYAIDQKLFLIHAPEPNACAGPEWRRPCRSGVKVYDSAGRVNVTTLSFNIQGVACGVFPLAGVVGGFCDFTSALRCASLFGLKFRTMRPTVAR